MTPSIVIAYRDFGCPHRAAAVQYVLDFLQPLGWETIVQGGDESFTRASGINAGIRHASGDIIVQIDPDSLVPHDQLRTAVALAAERDGMVIPHDRYRYLTPEATAEVLAGAPPFDEHAPYVQAGTGVGNATVYTRTTWEKAGGYDERFGLWGGDDAAFAYATAGYFGPYRRLDGPVVHLWHPPHPDSDPESRGYVDQFTLVAEYRDATAEGPEAVRAYVATR